jgi:YVTN family beta-propeller protein
MKNSSRDRCEYMDFSVGVLMTLWRVTRAAAILVLILAWSGCGDTFRPVAVPIPAPPPDPSSFHFVLMIGENGPHNPGSTTRIDVSGDSNAGEATVGLGPVHATVLPNSSRIYVANSLEDTVSSYAPSNAASVTTTSLPPGSVPVFVHTTENGTVYVANFGTGTVAAISTTNNVVTNLIAPGFPPITLAETPDGKKVYAVGGSNGAVSINTIGKTLNPPITDSSLGSPVWVVTRSDSQRAYILNQGSGAITVIDTFSDAVLSSVSVGAGANFMLYDPKRNRLYVTNPAAGTVSVLDASADPPNLLATDCVVLGSLPPCPTAFVPVSVTALADGSRAYVASYQVSSSQCLVDQPCSITSQVTVINASSNTISSVIPLGTVSVDAAINPVTGKVDDTGCNPATSTHPARFRLAATSSGDSSRVYVANCDAGSTAIIHTSNDQLMLNLPAPLSDFPTQNGANPLPQNPVFVLAGP